LLDQLKQAPLIWKILAFAGIPLAALFACSMAGAALYLALAPVPNPSAPVEPCI
jgi:hypothetical protein